MSYSSQNVDLSFNLALGINVLDWTNKSGGSKATLLVGERA